MTFNTRVCECDLLPFGKAVWFIAAKGSGLGGSDPWTEAPSKKDNASVDGPSAGPFKNGRHLADMEEVMKVWTKPAVREQEVGLEVTSYMPAEIDII
jgi:coenzyme PQQ precursor peptide PqqA